MFVLMQSKLYDPLCYKCKVFDRQKQIIFAYNLQLLNKFWEQRIYRKQQIH